MAVDLSLIPQNRVAELVSKLSSIDSSISTINTNITTNNNNAVHKTGNETVAGNKTFSGTTTFNNGIISTAANSGIMITNPNYTQGTAPSSTQWGRIDFRDKNNVEIAQCLTGVDNNNRSFAALWVHSPKASDTSSKWMLTAQCDTNGNYSLVSGVTPATSDNSTKIATTAFVKSILSTLYPVGSTYITTASTCPLATLISGSTWVLVSSGRVLQGADSGHAAGTTIEAGLPNIEGSTYIREAHGRFQGLQNNTGCIEVADSGVMENANGGGDTGGNMPRQLKINASRSSTIYGNSSTVQPPAYVVNMWQRTA